MKNCEYGYYEPNDNHQSIDHGSDLRYNNINTTRFNMLDNQENNMNHQPSNPNRKPHPSAKDPLEIRIRGLIREQAYSSLEGVNMWEESKRIQQQYFNDSLSNLDNPSYVHDRTQEVLREISQATKAHIIKGKEYVRSLKTPALIALNHYSGYKLNAFKPGEIDADFGEMEELYPFPSFFASMVPVAREVGDDVTLYDAHLEYGKKEDNMPLKKVQEEAGLLVIPEQNGGFTSTLESTKKIIEEHPRSLLVVFPEGESSGKRNNGGPYDMVDFHTGAFVIAGELGIPVLPAVQYFHPENGFQVVVLPPIGPRSFEKGLDGKATEESKAYYEQLAKETHDKMQLELNQLMGKES